MKAMQPNYKLFDFQQFVRNLRLPFVRCALLSLPLILSLCLMESTRPLSLRLSLGMKVEASAKKLRC